MKTDILFPNLTVLNREEAHNNNRERNNVKDND